MSEFNPVDSIPPSKLREMQQQLQQTQLPTDAPASFDVIHSTPQTFNGDQTFQHNSSAPQSQLPINPIGQLSVGEKAPTTNNMTEINQQDLNRLPSSEIPRNPMGQLADGEIKPKIDNNNSQASSPLNPTAQDIINVDDPMRLRDTARPSVNFDEVAAAQSGLSPRKREREAVDERTDIGGPSSLVTEEHMSESTESPSAAAKLKAKVEVTKDRVKGKVEDWQEEKKAKEEEKKRRKDYDDVVEESDPSLGNRIREKWENTKHKIGDKIDELKDRHEEKKRIKERQKELKESEKIAGDRGGN